VFPAIKDHPLLTINADRNSWIHDLTIVGANTIQDDVEPSYNPEDYLLNGITHDRYGGHIGIAVDYHAQAGSWGTTFERVFVDQCGTGWAVAPAGNTLNASGIKWLDCGVRHCDTGISWGQAQSRACYIKRFSASYTRLVFTGLAHGLQQGVPPIIDGFEGTWLHTIGRFNSRFGQTLSWDHMWAERIKGVIHWMGRDGASGCIRNSTFKINMVDPINPLLSEFNKHEGVAEAHSPFTFDNCNISRNPRGPVTFIEERKGLFKFINMPEFEREHVLA
jgi:hypothetical protein